jgi:hypothetical protein
MIHEEICTYEVCMLAKEKGFPQDVFGTCEMKSSCYLEDGRYYKNGCICPVEDAYTAPTQSLLQRWLREEEGIHISVEYEWVEGVDDWTFWAYIKKINNAKVVNDAIKSGFNTYELALEDALKYALENLV